MIHQDQLKRTLILDHTPKRIISLVPSQTELLVDLGLRASIIGVTKFCVHPNNLRHEKAVVGGTKQIHFDKIKVLNPDIILCNKEENTQEMIKELETIAPVHISDIYNLSDAFELIEMYGELFSVEKKSKSLIQNIKKAQQEFSKVIKSQPKLKVVYFIWKTPWMVVANNTFVDAMLSVNNFENYFGNLKRYPEIQLNEIGKEIDVILLSSEPFPFKTEHIEPLKKRFPKAKVVLVDGEFFSWYGSRLKSAFYYFKELHLSLLN